MKDQSVSGHVIELFPERYTVLKGSILSTILHSLASANFRAPQFLGTAAHYLCSYLPTDSNEKVRIIETYNNDELANIAWAFATTRYMSPAVNNMWNSLLSTIGYRFPVSNHNPKMNEMRKGEISYLNSSQMATFAWGTTTSSIPAPELLEKILQYIQYKVVSFSIPALAQIIWACAVQNVYNYDATYKIYEHILTITEKEQSEFSASRPSKISGTKFRSPDIVARYLLLPMNNLPKENQNGIRKLQAQLYTGLLGLQMHSLATPMSNENKEILHRIKNLFTPEKISLWKEALYANDIKVSKLQTDVSRVLSAARIPHIQEYASPEGLICDILINDRAIVNTYINNQKEKINANLKGIVVEIQGPTHFICGIDIIQNLVRDATGNIKFHPSDMVLSKHGTTNISDNIVFTQPIMDNNLKLEKSLLISTLRTQTKQRWLEQLGYKVITVNFIEWNNVPSTDEKMELLYEKGIPISKKLLAWG